MIKYDIPQQSGKKIFRSRELKGIDLCSAPSNVAPDRSPDTLNMINDGKGKLRKRMGYKPIPCSDSENGYDYEERINGVYDLGYTRLVHAGTKLYDHDHAGYIRLVSSSMNDDRSAFFNTPEGLFILDGEHFYKYAYDFRRGILTQVSDIAYVPTLVISRSPSGSPADASVNQNGETIGGGGVILEPLNLICDSWKESFLGGVNDTVYVLTEKNIDRVVTVETMNVNGEFGTLDASLYSVDTFNGTVTFLTSPGASAVEGMDNVIITVSKARTGYKSRINRCRFGIFYGADGMEERLFLSGNPDHPGMDFYSEYDNYTYFPDVNYSVLSSEACPVTGYSLVGNCLAAHLENGSGKSVIIRTGTVAESGKTEFRITDFISGPSAVSSGSIKHFEGESLFFSKDGVYAVTDSDLSERKIVSLRSMYLTGALRRLPFPEESCAAVYKDFYILSCDGKLFVLDGRQKQYSANVPKSAFQYEWYICGEIDARVMWVENGALCF
ncbi:MAG: hypothetical protein IJS94_08765, partial [Clostridia bacterium]|nr:hypothetical protein [Clostridia bacterium]